MHLTTSSATASTSTFKFRPGPVFGLRLPLHAYLINRKPTHDREQDMAAFDALPPALREELNYGLGAFPALWVREALHAGYSAAEVLDFLREVERQLLARPAA